MTKTNNMENITIKNRGTMLSFKGKKGFSLVEILIVILIIAVLMAVAVPNLLSSRNTGTDSAAKQLIAKVSTEFKSVSITSESFSSINTAALACGKVKGIAFVDASTASGKDSGTSCGGTGTNGTNARTVSMKSADSDQTMYFAVAGGGNNCWGLKISVIDADSFSSMKQTSATACTAEAVAAGTGFNRSEFGFPEAR